MLIFETTVSISRIHSLIVRSRSLASLKVGTWSKTRRLTANQKKGARMSQRKISWLIQLGKNTDALILLCNPMILQSCRPGSKDPHRLLSLANPLASPIQKKDLMSGPHAILIISNNGDAEPIAYQREFDLTVGPQATTTVSTSYALTCFLSADSRSVHSYR